MFSLFERFMTKPTTLREFEVIQRVMEARQSASSGSKQGIGQRNALKNHLTSVGPVGMKEKTLVTGRKTTLVPREVQSHPSSELFGRFCFLSCLNVILECPIPIIGIDILFLLRATVIFKPLAACVPVARDSVSLSPWSLIPLPGVDLKLGMTASRAGVSSPLQQLFS